MSDLILLGGLACIAALAGVGVASTALARPAASNPTVWLIAFAALTGLGLISRPAAAGVAAASVLLGGAAAIILHRRRGPHA